MTLLQVGALVGGLASGVGSDRVELGCEPGDEIRQLPLPSADLLQLFDEAGALPVGFIEEPVKHESKATRAISRHAPREGGNL